MFTPTTAADLVRNGMLLQKSIDALTDELFIAEEKVRSLNRQLDQATKELAVNTEEIFKQLTNPA